MYKTLIIEDDNNINDMLKTLLTFNHYEVISAYSGTEGILLHDSSVDLILLDLMLPGKNGEEIISELKNKKDVPIIVVSAIGEMDKKLDLFELGADDYITKPFNNDELLARIKVQLRHASLSVKDNYILTFKDIEMNISTHTVLCHQQPVSLSKTEFELLKVMMQNPNIVHTKNQLIELVWNSLYSGDDNTLNVHISKIRNKLKTAHPDEEYIETIWSIGYRLKQ
ncbi:MAG: response regulator transcription factor [Erysipelotrichaceae bacterium]|nr:response regulator transcription factor [Erysipelotrichaceae bacterium]